MATLPLPYQTKTALFIQLRNKIRRDKQNVVADLRPEGYQLIKLKEDILAYLSEGIAMGAACTGLDGGRASGCRNHRRRPRQAGDRYAISNQTPRPAAVASHCTKGWADRSQPPRVGSTVSPFEMYVRRWLRWVKGGMAKGGLVRSFRFQKRCLVVPLLKGVRPCPTISPPNQEAAARVVGRVRRLRGSYRAPRPPGRLNRPRGYGWPAVEAGGAIVARGIGLFPLAAAATA
jgi:hypothetical protein